MFRRLIAGVAACALMSTVGAQAVDAVKEAGKATVETAKEGGYKAKAAMESQPDKAVDKTRAHVHKTKAKYHRHKAKSDAGAVGH